MVIQAMITIQNLSVKAGEALEPPSLQMFSVKLHRQLFYLTQLLVCYSCRLGLSTCSVKMMHSGWIENKGVLGDKQGLQSLFLCPSISGWHSVLHKWSDRARWLWSFFR